MGTSTIHRLLDHDSVKELTENFNKIEIVTKKLDCEKPSFDTTNLTSDVPPLIYFRLTINDEI